MSNEPVPFAYAVKDRRPGQKSIWARIGAAWPHDKGAGLALSLDFLPAEPRIVLVEPKAAPPSVPNQKNASASLVLSAQNIGKSANPSVRSMLPK